MNQFFKWFGVTKCKNKTFLDLFSLSKQKHLHLHFIYYSKRKCSGANDSGIDVMALANLFFWSSSSSLLKFFFSNFFFLWLQLEVYSFQKAWISFDCSEIIIEGKNRIKSAINSHPNVYCPPRHSTDESPAVCGLCWMNKMKRKKKIRFMEMHKIVLFKLFLFKYLQ